MVAQRLRERQSEAALATINPDGTGPYIPDPAADYQPSTARRDLGWEAELRYHNAADSSSTAEQLRSLLFEHREGSSERNKVFL